MSNLVTEEFDYLTIGDKFLLSGDDIHCLAVTCEGCELIDTCKHEESEIDATAKTNIRRVLQPTRAPKGVYIGDTDKFILKTFSEKPDFNEEYILYNAESRDYICISGSCSGCIHLENCSPDIVEVTQKEPVVFSMDLKAQEPRAYAHFSKEPNWVKLFQNDTIRSIDYLYELLEELFINQIGIKTDSDTTHEFWEFLNNNFFEDKTVLYDLFTAVYTGDKDFLETIINLICSLYVKELPHTEDIVQDFLNKPLPLEALRNLLNLEIKNFPEVGDFHGSNAVAFFGEDDVKNAYFNDYPRFKDHYRGIAKANGLALNYGGSYKVLLRSIPGITEQEAKNLHSNYFDILNTFAAFLRKSWKNALKNLYITTMVGRRIFIWELGISEPKRQWIKHSSGKNNVSNYPIQGSSAEMVRIMLIKSYKYFTEGRLSLYDINYLANTTVDTNLLTVTEDEADIEELNSFIDSSKDGNCRIVITNEFGDKVLYKADRSIRVKRKDAKRLNLKEL